MLRMHTREHTREHTRWDRLQVALRCAFYPDQPGLIRTYLGVGQRLVALGVLDEVPAQQRMLQVLLQTAADSALPWAWRSACLEHVDRPLARWCSLLRLHDPLAVAALHAAVQAAREQLPLAPPMVASRGQA